MLQRLPLPVLLLAFGLGSCFCATGELPAPPRQCDSDGKGCLLDEECIAGFCQILDPCETDEDCPSAAYFCSRPAQICDIRSGFGLECEATTDCEPGFYCALGQCRDVLEGRPCGRRTDCPLGQACSQIHYVCIEEGPCTVADTFPELACEPNETCDTNTQRCLPECQNQCTAETQEADCGAGQFCDGACRCVQCISQEDCGIGLVCNVRAGRCESEDLCFDDSDCESPLICDAATALCQVPPPPCFVDEDCPLSAVCNRNTGLCENLDGECIDDRFEDADTPAQAEPVEVPLPGVTVTVDELQLCASDDDVYSFELMTGDNLVIVISGTSESAKATVWLLDPDGETSLRYAEAPPFGNGTISYVAQKPETVFLRVSSIAKQTGYEMTVEVNPGMTCPTDDFEGATGNDTEASATSEESLTLGSAFDAILCPSDVDFYRLSLAAGEGVHASVSFNATFADLDLALIDVASGELLDQSAGLAAGESVTYRTATARDVFVRVTGFANTASTYQMLLEKLQPLVCTPDAFEVDDMSPIAIGLGDSLIGVERSLCVDDVDRYSLFVNDFEKVVVRTSFIPNDLNLMIRAYEDGNDIPLAISPDSAGNETLVFAPGEDKNLIIELASVFQTGADYSLDIFRENVLDCTPDALEPNDSSSEGALIDGMPLPELSICGSDEDFFAIEGAAGKILKVETTFLHEDGDLDLMVLGLDGSQVLAASDGISDGESIEVELPLDGTYSIRVFSLSDEGSARYQLTTKLLD